MYTHTGRNKDKGQRKEQVESMLPARVGFVPSSHTHLGSKFCKLRSKELMWRCVSTGPS